MESDEEEIKAMKNGCEFIKTFLEGIKKKKKDKKDSPKEVAEIIESINNHLKAHVEGESEEERDEFFEELDERFKRVKTEKSEYLLQSNESLLNQLVKKIDNRTVPDLDKYDEHSGLSLEEYMSRFEEFCGEKFRGKTYLWLNELERHLEERILEGYKSVKQSDDSYESLKAKLLKWYEEEDETRKKAARKNFEKAKIKKEESLLMYSNRILQLYKLAFPNKKDYNYSETLINKFRNTIPLEAQVPINQHVFTIKVSNKEVSWELMQRCARVFDVERIHFRKEKKKGEDEDSEEDVIVVNLTKPNNLLNNTWQKKTNNNYREDNNNSNYKQQRYDDQNTFHDKKFVRPPPMSQGQMCNFCGRLGHVFNQCRKRTNACFSCGKLGHQAKKCWNKNKWRDQRGRRQSLSPPRNQQNGRTGRNNSYQGRPYNQPNLNH